MPSAAPPRFAVLDGIRGLAVLVVVVHNTAWIGGSGDWLVGKLYSAVAAAGWAGVQLFFVLSGFLITGILLDTRSTAGRARRFYVRRTLRIFPLYFAVLACAVLAAVTLGSRQAWGSEVVHRQWSYWLYLSNWFDPETHGISVLSHVWSLAVEEQFYLVWPLLVWKLSPERLRTLCLALVAAGPCIRYAMHLAGLPTSALYAFTVARVDALVLGALLAIIVRDTRLDALKARWLPIFAAVALAALLALVFRQRGLHDRELPVLVIGQSLVSLLSVCLVAWGAQRLPQGAMVWQRLLGQGPLANLGLYSYAIYLLHYPIHRFLQPHLQPWVLVGLDSVPLVRLVAYSLLVLGSAYAAARVTWTLLEQPCLAWRERLSSA